jgi:hypothetical protein
MKWARVKPSNYKPRSVEEKAQDELCYKDYAKEEHLRKAFEHRSHVWAHHEFVFPFGKEESYNAFQKRYEIFCGGYLFFYDYHVRSGVIDHVLYFRWSPYKRTGKFTVTIYLSPAPLRKRTKEESLRISEPELVTEAASTMSKKGNGIELLERTQPQTLNALAKKSGDTDNEIDPPPPPPPPPPPMV